MFGWQRRLKSFNLSEVVAVIVYLITEITARFQTARTEVRQLLLQYLLPWLVNIELVDPNVPPANPLSYIQARKYDIPVFILSERDVCLYAVSDKTVLYQPLMITCAAVFFLLSK